MTRQHFPDETLVAFADGELDAATEATLKAALDGDPVLAKRVATVRETRDVLKAALGPVAQEAVPHHLTRFVMSNGIAPVEPRAIPRRGASQFALPMAAALTFLLAGVGGYWIGARISSPLEGGMLAAVAAAEPELIRTLATAPDGTSRAWSGGRLSGDITLRASYRTRAGICRSFSIGAGAEAAIGGVACLGPSGWQTRVVGVARSSDDGIRPASGAGQVADDFLDSVEAEEPLNKAAVQDLIGKGWR
jgi:hypothetical protein